MSQHQTVDVGQLLDEGHWGNRQKLFVLLTALTIVFDGVDNQLLGIAVPAMMRDWAVPRGAFFRAIVASGMVGMMLGGALAGVVGDRMGRRVALIGSVLIFGVLTAAAALVDSLWALGVLRFLAGLGLGGAMPNAAALASEYVPRRHRPFAITLTIVCVPLGGTLAALVAGYVMPVFGWRTLFALGGALPLRRRRARSFPAGVSRFLARHPERRPELEQLLRQIGHTVTAGSRFVDLGEKSAPRASVGALFTRDFRRDTTALWGAMFACMLAVYTAFNWVPTMLAGAGLGLSVASNGIAAFNLGGVAGAICGGLIIARIGSRPTMLSIAAGAVCGAVTLALMPITASSNAVPIIAMLGVTGACINALQTTLYALAAHVYPTTVRATGVGTAVAFGRIGGVMSSCAGEWALGAGGTSAFFALMAGSMAVVFVCLSLVGRHVPASER